MSKLIAAFALMLAAISPAYAQSADEAAVTKANETLSKAIVAADKAALEKITWPELTYGHSAGKVENQREFVDALVTKQSVIKSIENVKLASTLAGDVAVTRGTATFMVGGANGAVTKADLTLVLVWHKRNGEWRLVARQAFKV
ncbi:MAG TPA: nuclear transport factor 2 family protein [Steroidobacteraceae bacterium]|nr:nuclear transport factor 2 family protein [Steroidobacteraceae bacterium]